MPIKSDSHIFGGMLRDYDIAKHLSLFLYDAKNIRFTPIEGDTMLAITNEKGPLEQYTIEGNYLGHYTFNDFIVIFTRFEDTEHSPEDEEYESPTDYIYKIEPNAATDIVKLLYSGNLNFSLNNPIETLGVYENDYLSKVYWVDGRNLPRVVKLTKPEELDYSSKVFPDSNGVDTQFDFVPYLTLDEEISVDRIAGEGMFAPGVILYAFAYYKLNGLESNIFYTTPLNYITFNNRAGNPEERIANSFRITVNKVEDDKFDFIRIFSIHRTSYNAVPTVKRVIDLKLNGVENHKLIYVDDGTMGDIIDPTELLYIGGEHIIANTIVSKDNTLFLGNLEIKRQETLKDNITLTPLFSDSLLSKNISRDSVSSGYYTYTNGLLSNINGFKNREHYRLGVQFQHRTGKWSLPIMLNDHTVNLHGGPDLIEYENSAEYKKIKIDGTITIDSNGLQFLHQNNYVKIRPVCVFPDINDRLVLTQGILCPTVYKYKDRINNAPYSQSSWFFRLNPSKSVTDNTDMLTDDANIGAGWVEFRHNHLLRPDNTYGGEILGFNINNINYTTDISPSSSNSDIYNLAYAVDQSILTMHSPDIEFDDDINYVTDINWKLRLVGISNFTSVFGDFDILTSTPSAYGVGFNHYTIGFRDSYESALGLVASRGYKDDGVLINVDEYVSATLFTRGSSMVNVNDFINRSFIVYPWHRSGSINNDEKRPSNLGVRTSVLLNKKIGNLRFSLNNSWFSSVKDYVITSINIHDSDLLSILRILNNNYGKASSTYYGNIDTMLIYNDDNYAPKVAGSSSIENLPSSTEESSLKVPNDKNLSIRMKYKSTKHFIFGIKGDNNKTFTILPSIGSINTVPSSVLYPLDWMDGSGDASSIIDFVGCSYYAVGLWWNDHKRDFEMTSGNTYILAYFWDTHYSHNSEPGNYICRGTLYKVLKDLYDDWILTDMSEFNDTYQYHRITEQANTYDIFMYKGDSKVEFIYSKNTPIYSGDTSYTISLQNINIANLIDYPDATLKYPYLFLAELYRDGNELTDFGGTTDDAILHNVWIPAGEPVLLPNLEGNNQNYDINLIYDQGDTWYTRYDCLKTYPFTEEDENSIIEVGSFMCESRVNGDGRYDKNRGEINNILNFRPTNFNLLNPVYSQLNNFFSYRLIDSTLASLNLLPNTITWSKVNPLGNDIDLWTNITMANTLDLDGVLGLIQSLLLFNDRIICFQDTAISNILFNSRVLIPVSDGVPIEISNGLKVDGSVYLSTNYGCNNKWSIAITPSGIYFIDTTSKLLMNLGDNTSSVSGTHGFSEWFKNKDEHKSLRTSYDFVNNDLYLNWLDTSLVFSETLGLFTSFMSYENVPSIFNIGNNTLCLRNDGSQCKVYKMFSGDYCKFFGNKEDYYIQFISNPDSSLDKTFLNVESRIDFKNNDEYLPRKFFDYIRVTDEYQDTYDTTITTNRIRVTNPYTSGRKKFRIWRTEIPRAFDVERNRRTLDRIRNTWASIKLTMDSSKVDANWENTQMIMHDIEVLYLI